MVSDRRLKVSVLVPALMPSVVIGVLRPLRVLHRLGIISLRILRESRWTIEDLIRSDVLVFCRNQSPEAYTALLVAKYHGVRVINEIDDNFFDIPIGTAMGRYHRQPVFLHTQRRLFELSDLTRVYTRNMQELAESFDASVQRVVSYFDRSLVDISAPRRIGGPVRIAFATGRSPDPQIEAALEGAILDVIEAKGSAVEFHFWRKPSQSLLRTGRVRVHAATPDYDSFIRRFFKAGYDIGLAPLAKTRFYESKTNNKFREYGGSFVAGIYSDAAPYVDSVDNGVTGLVIENTRNAWRAAMLLLIDDKKMRERIAKAARAEIEAKYSFEQAVLDWCVSIERVLSKPPSSTDIKPLFHGRNLVLMQGRLPQAVRALPSFPVSWVRGKDWSPIGYFPTRITDGFTEAGLIDDPRVKTFVYSANTLALPERSLRSIDESGMLLIVDVRMASPSEIDRFVALLDFCRITRAILVGSHQQASLLGLDQLAAAKACAYVTDPFYPRPMRAQTSYGYAVLAPGDRDQLRDFNLANNRAVWLELFDAAAALLPLGKPLPKERWYVRLSPSAFRNRLRRIAFHRDLPTALSVRAKSHLYEIIWIYFPSLLRLSSQDPAVIARSVSLKDLVVQFLSKEIDGGSR